MYDNDDIVKVTVNGKQVDYDISKHNTISLKGRMLSLWQIVLQKVFNIKPKFKVHITYQSYIDMLHYNNNNVVKKQYKRIQKGVQ